MSLHLKYSHFFPATLAIIFANALLVAPGNCAAVAAVNGVVKDAEGTALAGVTVQLCGLEVLQDGSWKRELRLGEMPRYRTDEHGGFQFPFNDPNMRFDVYFDKDGFAPVFLYAISNSTPELNVTMTRGQTLSGTVTKRVNGQLEPANGIGVELRLPNWDLWYQHKTTTDQRGKYSFQVSPPPEKRKWQVVCRQKVSEAEVTKEKPITGPDFEIEEN